MRLNSGRICENVNRNSIFVFTQYVLHCFCWTCPFNNMRITLIKVIITLFLFTEKVTCTSSDNGILSTPSRLLCCHFTSFSYLPIFVSRVLCTNLELMLKMRQITTVDNDVAVIWRVFINCFAGFFIDLELMLKICQITTLLVMLLCCYLPLF